MEPQYGDSLDYLDKYVAGQIIIIRPDTVVDFGAGGGKYGKMLRNIPECKNCKIIAVEGYLPAVEHLKSLGLYDSVENILIQKWVDRKNQMYDVAIFGDVLEHLTAGEIRKVIGKALKCFKNIIICVPLRNIFQGVLYGNKLEEHKAYIMEDFFNSYPIREKHLVMIDRNDFKMNIWIVNCKRNKLKNALIDFVCILLDRQAIFAVKKVLVNLGLYEKIKRKP
jgi:hypothetical protein